MGTEIAIRVSEYLSAVLACLSAQAGIVAIVRLITGPAKISNGVVAQAEAVTAGRKLVLTAFILYCVGTVMRESVVIVASSLHWGMAEFEWSGAARAIKITAACLFVFAISRNICGSWLWISILGISVAFSIVLLH